MLPSPGLWPTGRCLIEFDSPVNAMRFRDAAVGRSCPGSPNRVLVCKLVEPTKPPFPAALSDRTPLALRGDELLNIREDGTVNLSSSLAWSGRAVLLSGFPRRLPVPWILRQLAKEDFSVVEAPGLASDGGALDNLVQLHQ